MDLKRMADRGGSTPIPICDLFGFAEKAENRW